MNGPLARRAAVVLLLTLVPLLEGRSYRPYYDSVNVKTVCDGNTNHVEDRTYSDAECDAILEQNLDTALNAVGRCTLVDLQPKTIAALASFTFNVGETAFCQSTLVKKINAGHGAAACDEMLRWVYAKKQMIKGLKRRRQVERDMCVEGFAA